MSKNVHVSTLVVRSTVRKEVVDAINEALNALVLSGHIDDSEQDGWAWTFWDGAMEAQDV